MPDGRRTSHPAFPTTQWSLVLRAARRDGSASQTSSNSFADLCSAYWDPLFRYLRHTGLNAADAEDLVQGFLCSLTTPTSIARIDPARGRFRSYLLSALRHYTSNRRARAAAKKRGGDIRHVSLSSDARVQAEVQLITTSRSPEAAYIKGWAETVLKLAHEGLRETYARGGKTQQFEVLLPFLTSHRPPRHQEVAATLGVSEPHARVLVHRFRSRFGTVLRSVVAETVATPEEVDDELRTLLSAAQGVEDVLP